MSTQLEWVQSPTTASSESDYTQITAQDTLKVIYFMIGSVGLVGNGLVVAVIVNSPSMRTTFTNWLLLNQSVCDGLVALILLLSSALEDDGRHLSGPADMLYCRVWLTKMPLWGTLVSSTYNLLALTMERYLAVVHPIWHKLSFSRAKLVAVVVLVWTVGPAYNLAYMAPSTEIQDGVCNLYDVWPSDSVQRGIGILTILLQFFIPLTILIFCYTRMTLVLKKRVHPTGGNNPTVPGPSRVINPRSVGMARARRNLFKTLALVSVSFIVCWIWNQVYFLLFNLGYEHIDFQSNFYHFTVVMVFCNCCINPFIYLAKYEQFQKGLRQLFCKGRANATDFSLTASPTIT